MAGAARRGYYGEDGIYFDHRSDCRDSALHMTCAGQAEPESGLVWSSTKPSSIIASLRSISWNLTVWPICLGP